MMLVDDGCRRIGRIAAAQEFGLEAVQEGCAEENDHRRLMSGVIGDFLLIRHGRPPFHAGDDDRLADARQGIFGLEGRSGGTEGADTGYDVIGDALLGEDVHLLADGAID